MFSAIQLSIQSHLGNCIASILYHYTVKQIFVSMSEYDVINQYKR